MNFKRKIVEQALGVNHSQVVWFLQITDAIPDQVLTAIGRAPTIGRPRWRVLADLFAAPGNAKRAETLIQTPEFQRRSSDDRFSYLATELTIRTASPSERQAWSAPQGPARATFIASKSKSVIEIDRRHDPDFANFLFSKLDDLYQDYKAQSAKK
jgi:ParB family transcriptional regulator, chromosome partitioning protein